jgi:hypothetical protein
MLTRDATMWYNAPSNMVYWYGGMPYATMQPAVWGFSPNTQGTVAWSESYSAGIGKTATGSTTFNGFTETVGASYAYSPTTYYALGGYTNSLTDPALSQQLGNVAATGMVTYSGGSWSNVSSAGYYEGFAAHGEAVYVPIFGQAGILVFLGGDAPTGETFTQGASRAAMSDVTIYDIQSGKFYLQRATGTELPMGRIQFCATGVASARNTSYEMYVSSTFLSKKELPNDPVDLYLVGTMGGKRPALFRQTWPLITVSSISSHFLPFNGSKSLQMEPNGMHTPVEPSESDR